MDQKRMGNLKFKMSLRKKSTKLPEIIEESGPFNEFTQRRIESIVKQCDEKQASYPESVSSKYKLIPESKIF